MIQRVGNRARLWQLVSPNDQLANSSSRWDLSTQEGSSGPWTWAPLSSELPSRGQKRWAYIGDLLMGCEEDINFQGGLSEETEVRARNEVSCPGASQNVTPNWSHHF